MEFWPAACSVPETEFVAATAFASAPEPVFDGVLGVDVSTDVNPALIWINCCRLFTPTSCEM
jgi:hypothetical protein